MSDSSFDRIWNARLFVYDPTKELERQLPCAFARTLHAWVEVLFEKHLDGADQVRLNQLKLVIQDKFFELQVRVPSDHRQEDDREPDHPCLFSTYARAIEVLHERELDLEPPALAPPIQSPPASPKRKRRGPLDGLILGDKDEEFGP
jgi:hypothetical protein